MKPFAYTLAFLLVAALGPVDAAKVGGKLSPTGEEIHVDLPEKLHRANVSSRGEGCCVFRSIHHASLWQHVPQLNDFPEWLQKKGLSGGGYPGNVTDRIKKICAERGVPQPAYIQIEGSVEEDLKILEAATKSGRMPGITYGISPTGRYGGRRIAHMTNLVHCDLAKDEICQLDNNHISVAQYEWMNKKEFIRAYTSGGSRGWAVILLDPGPPPLPWN